MTMERNENAKESLIGRLMLLNDILSIIQSEFGDTAETDLGTNDSTPMCVKTSFKVQRNAMGKPVCLIVRENVAGGDILKRRKRVSS